MEQTVPKETMTFTDMLRKRFKYLLDPFARALNRMGLMPNTVTILGLVGNAIAAVLLGLGHITAGGIIVLLMGPIDALDGTMARLRGESSDFGAFVDSVTDRYSELVILGGLLVYYLRTENWLGSLLIYLAAAGSVLVSYIRARGQSLNLDTKVGLLTRVERFLVLAPCLIINQPMIALWILAVLTNVTALQRIADVRRQAYAQNRIAKKNPPIGQ
ncbi:MAG: CDP-alcohol phosphatidyltransferase family protein [Anaerolineaceae bacterium]|nr:CDP-alcohol phosphatidyltransferase family protein [Anaerolineaceae bacterium]